MIFKRSRVIMLAVLAVGLIVSATTPAATSADAVADKVAPRVLQDTAGGSSTSFLVILASKADLSGAGTLATKEAKGRFVFETLTAHAARTQAPIKTMLDRMGVTYESHWVVNFLTVTGNRSVVQALAARADVASIEPNLRVRSAILPKGKAIPAAGPSAPGTIEWNVSRIKAPRVWGLGFTGQGMVLGDIDTGQQWDHPALKPHYRGWDGATADHNYNWFDKTSANSQVPVDPNGHGTHTAGTMIGDDGGTNQIGVAPDAQWIGCRAMDASGLGDPSTYGGCFEFMIAPTDLNGENPDPSLGPTAVSNSWYCSISLGECPDQEVLHEVVRNVRTAGIVVVVSAGNSGPSCDTIGNDGPPAQYNESYTVGASTISNTLAIFSSRGPAESEGDTLIKPDIVAPGEGVRSSYPPNTYATLSGTSMASPHIAGAIALIHSAKPGLLGNVTGTERLINRTATHINSSLCSSNGSYPNNLWGYGFVNVLKAVQF
jgi:serine protease AprX